jgi:Cysteinyl-tRNA synthetase
LAVHYVQNVTDIDDDILRKAAEVGVDWRALGNRWTSHFIGDMQALNVRPPDDYPRATDVIPDIVTAVGGLIERGLAYVSGGSVYYHVDAWPAFGRLSALPRSEMLAVANERGNRPSIRTSATPSTSCCGRRRGRANRRGTARGVRAVPAGTSNAR